MNINELLRCAVNKFIKSKDHHDGFGYVDPYTGKVETACAIGAINACLTGDTGGTETTLRYDEGVEAIEALYAALPASARAGARLLNGETDDELLDTHSKSAAIQDYNDSRTKGAVTRVFNRAVSATAA